MHDTLAKGILSAKNGMNVYRGCTHGCIYCDSRSKCYQMDHIFEDIEVKANAPQLLESALRKKRAPCMISTGAMCDPYLPIESTRQITRRCLEIIDRYGFGAALLTKSKLILRDLELLKSINEKTKCVVSMTLTTYDEELCRILEPNVATTRERFEVLCALRDAGIPTVVWLCPILPFINDTPENLQGIINYCVEAKVQGVLTFAMGLTLRDGNREYFYSQLDKHFPGMKERYIAQFGTSYECNSPNSARLMAQLRQTCSRAGIMHDPHQIFNYLSKFEDKQSGQQLSLF